MFAPVRGRARGRTAARFVGPALILLNLSLLGCGVPLAAAELTATAEVSASMGSATEVSSRAASTNLLDSQATPGPAAAQTPLSTIGPVGAPQGTATAATPLASASPSPGTPAITRTAVVTPGTTLTPRATVSLTPAAVTPSPAAAAVVTAVADLAVSAANVPATDPAAAFIKLLNDYRASSGRSQLVVNPSLAASSVSYAQLMARTNYFGHTGPDGSIAETRIAAAGYRGRFKGEALAAGQASADAALRNWLTSPSHASIVLDSSAVEVGIGYAYNAGSSYGHYWVLVTGVPQ